MKKLFLPLFNAVLLSTVVLFGVTACDKHGNADVPLVQSKINAANAAKIQPGMTRTQVVAMLGEPTTSEMKDMVIFKKNTVNYVDGKNSISVVYKNDEVQESHSTFGGDAATSTTTTTTKTE